MSRKFNRNFFVSCIFVFITIIFSCTNITTPKKITIQTDPELNVSLGKIETSLTDYFSVEKIKELIGENENFSIYDYKHDKNDDTLRFLAQIDYSMEIDGLDVEGSLKELESLDPISFGYEEDGVTPSVLFSIPEINQTIDIDPISLNLTENITSSIKDFSSISFQGLQPGLIQDLENQNIPYPIELCNDEFDTVTFGDGTSLEIGFEKITGSSITTAKINKVSIYNAQDILGMSVKEFNEKDISLDILNLGSVNFDNPIASTTTETDLIAGTNLNSSINLSNVTLPKDICLVLTVSFEGGDGYSPVEITTTKSEFSGLTFKEITGFNTQTPIEIPFPAIDNIDIGSGIEGLKSATIGSEDTDGEIIFSFDNLPSGITPTTKLSFTQANTEYQGLNINNETIENNKISLAGKSLNTNPIQISGNIQIEAVNADIDLTQELKVSTGVKIEKFASISMEDSIIPQDVFTQTYSYPLDDIAEYVNKITFNEVGLDLKLCNGLPFEATMNVTSNFLRLSNQPYTFEGNNSGLQGQKITSGSPETPLVKEITNTTEFDLSINLSLPSSNGVITIPNVVTGTDYKFYGQAELIIDWFSVNFILPDDYSGFKGSFPEEGGELIDLSSITNILGDDITLSGIKPNLYLSSPLFKTGAALEKAKIQTVMKVSYTKDDNEITEYLVGSDTSRDALKIVDFPKLIPDKNSIIMGKLPEPSTELSKLIDIMLSGAKNLKIEYDIELSDSTDTGDLSTGITIEKSKIDNLPQSSEIKIGILIDLPIIFSVKPNEKGYGAINFISLINQNSDQTEPTTETDFFGRSAGEELEGLTTIFDFIENAAIKLQYKNNTGMVLTLVIKDTNEKNQTFSKIVNLGKGEGTIELKFDENDAKYIQATTPFYPDILEIQLPGNKTSTTEYKIKRNASLDVTLQGSIKTDINYSIDLDSSKGEN